MRYCMDFKGVMNQTNEVSGRFGFSSGSGSSRPRPAGDFSDSSKVIRWISASTFPVTSFSPVGLASSVRRNGHHPLMRRSWKSFFRLKGWNRELCSYRNSWKISILKRASFNSAAFGSLGSSWHCIQIKRDLSKKIVISLVTPNVFETLDKMPYASLAEPARGLRHTSRPLCATASALCGKVAS